MSRLNRKGRPEKGTRPRKKRQKKRGGVQQSRQMGVVQTQKIKKKKKAEKGLSAKTKKNTTSIWWKGEALGKN